MNQNYWKELNNNKTFGFIILHFTVFLWGMTAIFGKLISYSSLELVWHRTTITTFFFFNNTKYNKSNIIITL